MDKAIKNLLHEGTVIPAHPLVLNKERQLDEERQRRLTRYYIAAGAGGVAVGSEALQPLLHALGDEALEQRQDCKVVADQFLKVTVD